jgi:hypothetical protein
MNSKMPMADEVAEREATVDDAIANAELEGFTSPTFGGFDGLAGPSDRR